MAPTNLHRNSHLWKMRLYDLLEEAERDRLATRVAKAAPANDRDLSASVSSILSRGPAAVRHAAQAFWVQALLTATKAVR